MQHPGASSHSSRRDVRVAAVIEPPPLRCHNPLFPATKAVQTKGVCTVRTPVKVFAAAVAAVVAGMMFTGPAAAQEGYSPDGVPDLGKTTWMGASPCAECHGIFADGVMEIAQQPQGADLRTGTLSPEEMFAVIKCGRPATLMPYFFRNAWEPPRSCFGMTRRDVGDMLPDRGDRLMPDRLINALVAFIFRDIVGAGPVTFEYCREFLGREASRCEGYPREAN